MAKRSRRRPPQTRSRKIIEILLFISHVLVLVGGVGFVLGAHYTQNTEAEDDLDLRITSDVVDVYYCVSGALILSSILGFAAHFGSNRTCFWILYCTTLSLCVLVEVAIGGSAISKAENDKNVRAKLLHIYVEPYHRDPHFHEYKNYTDTRTTLEKKWDTIQMKYKCCGLNDWTDWQDVKFGRTSLAVPTSCCKGIKKRKKDPKDLNWRICGINKLPTIEEDDPDEIWIKGCQRLLMEKINFHLGVLEWYGIVCAVMQILIVGVTSWLLLAKKI